MYYKLQPKDSKYSTAGFSVTKQTISHSQIVMVCYVPGLLLAKVGLPCA